MNKQVKVSQVMSSKLITLHPKDKLRRAKEIFDQFGIHHIPVQVMDDIRGIISLGDILYLEGLVKDSFDEFIKNKKLDSMTIDEVMTKRPYTIDCQELLSNAIDIMVDKRVNALLISENEKLVGIVTTYDILKYMKKGLSELDE